MPAVNKAFDNDFDVPNSLPQKSQIDSDVSTSVPGSEKKTIQGKQCGEDQSSGMSIGL